ncbi:type 1 fimbrial protein [Enterobacter ludwigii]|uniref:fimbrial protein n=1 Tax=Enterobacter ludwigii TaxID=299767 RepID=UPI0030765148
MTNRIFKMAAMAALVAGGINMAHAASSTTVTVHGTVNTVTCDIAADKTDIDLGNMLPADFTAAATFPTGKTSDFNIALTGCQGTATPTGQATLKLSGPVTASGDMYFSDDAASQAAVGVAMKATPTVLLSNGAVINAGAAGATTTVLNSTTLAFTTGLISSSANTTSGQQISAPLAFKFIYN